MTDLARQDGILYGEVLYPAGMAWDGVRYGGPAPRVVNGDGVAAMPGVVRLVRQECFVGLVAQSPIFARQAMERLVVEWMPAPRAAMGASAAAVPAARRYEWETRAPAMGAQVAAWWHGDAVKAWCGGLPDAISALCRRELAALLGLAEERVEVAAQPGFASAEPYAVIDALAAAAVLSRSVRAPVSVPVQGASRGASIALSVGMSDQATDALPCAISAPVPWAVRPSLARMLCQPEQVRAVQPIDTPDTPYGPVEWRVVPVRSADGGHAAHDDLLAAKVFAQESFVDELVREAGDDAIAYRLRHMPDGRGRRLVEQLAASADWRGAASALAVPDAGGLRGRGFAFAEMRQPGDGEAGQQSWAAWVVDVSVDAATGRIDVTRVAVGHDSASLQPARELDIIQDDARLLASARRLLSGPRQTEGRGASPPAAETADGAPASPVGAVALPASELVASGALRTDGVLTLPASAAIANAVFDATGVRLRQVPFDGAALRTALADRRNETAGALGFLARGAKGWRRAAGAFGIAAGLAAALPAMLWPFKPGIAPTAGPDVSLYSSEAIERGRLVAAAGDCAVCHTAPGGRANAGGLALDTPFGTVYTSNITPDPETGIGRWSYPAFERAMREGISRDGHHLYPAFPYTAFAKLSDADMQALYAYLMAQPAVAATPPKTELAFPYSVRPLVAGWNTLFLERGVFTPDSAQSVEWNRGAYLVEGAGHCGACHTPRNALGAEKSGIGAYLSGGSAEGWEAPALNALSKSPVPWTPDDLFQYLRTGFSALHGVAGGPMAPVIHGLAQLPESDVRAIAVYLTSLGGAQQRAVEPAPVGAAAQASLLEQGQAEQGASLFPGGQRIYQSACAVCHEAGQGPTLFGVKPSLSLNTNLHSAQPDNLIQVILHGIQEPAQEDLGYMPGFKDSLDDRQIAELIGYLRARFGAGEPAWDGLEQRVRAIREQEDRKAPAQAARAFR